LRAVSTLLIIRAFDWLRCRRARCRTSFIMNQLRQQRISGQP
jgi:hypothetical protein